MTEQDIDRMAASARNCDYAGAALDMQQMAHEIQRCRLASDDRATLQRIRDNEARVLNSIGFFDEGIRKSCESAIALMDRLLAR